MAQWENLSIWRPEVNPQNPHLKRNASVKPAALQRDGRQRQEPQVNTPKPDSLEYIASQQNSRSKRGCGSTRREVRDTCTRGRSVHRCKVN